MISEVSVPSHQHLESVISHNRRHYMPYEFSAGFPFPSVQFLGKGAETRHTGRGLPELYVIEAGHETAWMLNVHVLDTRGAVNPTGCVECRCDLYNATTDELDGQPLPEGYIGGLQCCGVGQQCARREGFNGAARTLHLRYQTYPCRCSPVHMNSSLDLPQSFLNIQGAVTSMNVR